MRPGKSTITDEGFDLFRNDALIRWQRKMHIAPQQGLGVLRRAIFFAGVTWLPLVVWAALNRRLVDVENGEPLLAHFGIHVRCLVAIPLFVLAESMALKVIDRIVGQFRARGIVTEQEHPAFLATLADAARLRDSSLPWVAVFGLAVAWTLGSPVHADSHDMSWAVTSGDFGFGGWWFICVARPVFIVLLLGWLWRIGLVMLVFSRLSRLDLSLVPTHPDRNGGLGFVKKLPSAFFLVTLAVSSVIASRWMHEMVYHDQTLASFKAPFVAFVVLWSAMLLLPLLMLAPRIAAMKRQALRQYGALIGEHGRLVHRRWILGAPVPPTELLDAPELGPVADTAAIYEAVANVKPLPVGKSTVVMVLVPIVLPMLFVIAWQIPIRELLLKLLKTLV
ncbi:MAG: hypothetical protein JHC40_12875 [Burkholderiales bacterium]|nr:hypothetical protein [Burkholderiales bacterium]